MAAAPIDDINLDIQPYVPYLVYQNLPKLLEYRQLVPINPSWLSRDDFIRGIQFNRHTIVEAKDKSPRPRRIRGAHPSTVAMPVRTFIIIVDNDSPVVTASAEFQKLIWSIAGFRESDRRPQNYDIIVISDTDLKSNMIKKIADLVTLGKDGVGWNRINAYNSDIFTTVRPEAAIVPRHELLSREEADKVAQDPRTPPAGLSKIMETDPIAIWFGAEPGDIMIQHIPSRSGYALKYNMVRPSR